MKLKHDCRITTICAAFLLATGEAAAQSLHQVPVKTVEPVTVQQATNQTICSPAHAVAQVPPGASETAVGAVIGGAIGNALVSGPGQVAATVLGALAGGSLAQQAQAPRIVTTPLENCVVQPITQNITMFRVRFEWESKDYEVFLSQQPAQTIAVQVHDAGAGGAPTLAVLAPHPATMSPPQPTAPQVMPMVQAPVVSYVAPYPYGYVAPRVIVVPTFGFSYGYGYYPRAYLGGWHGYYGYGRRWR